MFFQILLIFAAVIIGGVFFGGLKMLAKRVKRRRGGYGMRQINAFRKQQRKKTAAEQTESLNQRKQVAVDNATVPVTLIAGVVCGKCGVPMAKRGAGMEICLRCHRHPIGAELDQVRLAVEFDRTVNYIVFQRLRKKPHRKHLEQFSAHIVAASKVNNLTEGSPLVVAIPKANADLPTDGYHLGKVLATRVAKAAGLRMVKLELEHDKLALHGRVKNRHVLIVDDFIDDEYRTLQEVAKALKAQGALTVKALVLARKLDFWHKEVSASYYEAMAPEEEEFEIEN